MKSHSQILKFKIQKLRNEISLPDFEIQNSKFKIQNSGMKSHSQILKFKIRF